MGSSSKLSYHSIFKVSERYVKRHPNGRHKRALNRDRLHKWPSASTCTLRGSLVYVPVCVDHQKELRYQNYFPNTKRSAKSTKQTLEIKQSISDEYRKHTKCEASGK
eukprot:sb/3477697/